MTNKFYKVLGICLLIVIFPVMVVSTAVVLKDSDNGNAETKIEASYSVKNDYGDATTLNYDKTAEVWKINNVPERAYYNFYGIKVSVDGADKEFKMNDDKTIKVANKEEKDKLFNAIVKDKKKVSCVWSCVYDFCVKFGTTWRSFVNPDHKDGGFIFYELESIENTGLLEQIGYLDLEAEDQNKDDIVVKVYTDTTIETGNVINLGTTSTTVDLEWNPQTDGDITFLELLNLLASKGVNITPNGYNLGIELI